MTGGLAVVLGRTGINFGAGMTGGLAWVYDEDADFLGGRRFHEAFLEPATWEQLDAAGQSEIRELVALHAEKTASTRAKWLLANWNSEAPKFVRLTPKPQS
jgi:glutamate synthase domain-containing protein 3